MTLTRFQLKILAICSMFLDHAMKIFEDVLEPAMGQTLYTAVLSLGRMAFLIFAFQLAEGVWHTHNVRAYLKRLFGFALLSEIPFQMVKSLILTGKISLSFGLTNVLMTLFLGVLSCVAYAYAAQKDRRDMGKFAVFLIALLAEVMGTDYGGFGVVFVFVLWYTWHSPQRWRAMFWMILFYYSLWIPLALLSWGITFAAVFESFMYLAVALGTWALLRQYHGEVGQKGGKYAFYLFYPVHLLCLAGAYCLVM